MRFSPGKKKNVKYSRLEHIRERIRGPGTSTDDSEYLLRCLDKAEAALRLIQLKEFLKVAELAGSSIGIEIARNYFAEEK